MRTRYLFIVTLCVAVLVAGIVLIGANFVRAGTNLLSKTTPQATGAQAPRTPVTTEVGLSNPSKVVPTPSIAAPPENGSSLLQSRCTQCHELQWLRQVKKTRTGWDETVSQMEWFGVKISDAEKTVLLDYLAGVDEP